MNLSEDMNVKVADYAMFCEEFVGDYHVLADGSRMPLRWMAWESLLMVNTTLTIPNGESIFPVKNKIIYTVFVVGSTITSQ